MTDLPVPMAKENCFTYHLNDLSGFYPFPPSSPMPNFLQIAQLTTPIFSRSPGKRCEWISPHTCACKTHFWACSDGPYLWRSRRPGHFFRGSGGKNIFAMSARIFTFWPPLYSVTRLLSHNSSVTEIFSVVAGHSETQSENSSSNFFECWSTLEKKWASCSSLPGEIKEFSSPIIFTGLWRRVMSMEEREPFVPVKLIPKLVRIRKAIVECSDKKWGKSLLTP